MHGEDDGRPPHGSIADVEHHAIVVELMREAMNQTQQICC